MNLVKNSSVFYQVEANGTYVELRNINSNVSPTNITCNEDSGVRYDYEGAMKFTIAVVMVYGIGIIGLLGIYSKKKRIAEDKIKEGDTFVRTLAQTRHIMEKKSRKSAITKLVSNISGENILLKSPTIGGLALNPVLNIAIPSNASIDPTRLNPQRVDVNQARPTPTKKNTKTRKTVEFMLEPVAIESPEELEREKLSENNNKAETGSTIPKGSASVTYVCEESIPKMDSRRNALKVSMDTRTKNPKIPGSEESKRDTTVTIQEVKPLLHTESFV